MAITFGFYNSVAGDRVYDAIQLSSLFDGVLIDGVFEDFEDALEVSENSGMDINVAKGKAWFDHTWTLNDAVLVLTVPAADIIYPRLDYVVLEVDASDSVRENTIKIISGDPYSVPVEPDLIQTAEVHQYPLALIAVAANATEILDADITKLVGSYLCPHVTFPNSGASTGGAAVLEVQVFS